MNSARIKIIKASAGTGKTYRISLEYIRILLDYQNCKVSPAEILAITFTNKATAEIKERIYEHLELLTQKRNSDPDYKILVDNLEQITPVTKLTDSNFAYLNQIYKDMLKNKNMLVYQTGPLNT